MNLVQKYLFHGLGLLVGHVVGVHALAPRGGELRFQLVQQAGILIGSHLPDTLADGPQLLCRRHASRVRFIDSAILDDLQPADANHEELVQVGRGDGKKSESLQQGSARVARLVQHALIEFEPTQFSVDVFLWRGCHGVFYCGLAWIPVKSCVSA